MEALHEQKRPPGRRTTEWLERRLGEIEHELGNGVSPLDRVLLTQERMDVEADLAERADTRDDAALEAAFVEVVGLFSERKGISYRAWRECGVPARVLKAAGVPR